MNRFLAAAAVVAVAAAPAIAGGIYVEVKAARESFVRDADGRAALELTIENKGGCFGSALLDADENLPGPAIALERKDGEKWVPVKDPWDASKREGTILDKTHPFRVDIGMKVTVARRANVPAGTYRAHIHAVVGRGTGHEWRQEWHSSPFTVVEAPSR